MPDAIIENGVFNIPLFHGTSTLFLESIQTYGLGGVNPIDVYSVCAFVQEAYEFCEHVLSGDKEWEACKFSPRWLIDQESFNDNSNFQHGDTYLTPSRPSAVGYALTNRFGSELLSMGAKLVALIRERRPELIHQCPLVRHPAMNLISSDSKPVLVTARNVSVDMLLSEGGDTPEKAIEQLKTLWPILGDTGDVLNINFRLRHALSANSFNIEYLDPTCEKRKKRKGSSPLLALDIADWID